jgi:hypothetical protein
LTCEFAGVFEGVLAKKIRGDLLRASWKRRQPSSWLVEQISVPPIAKCSMDRAPADFRVMLTLLAVLNAGMWFIDKGVT